LQLLVDVPKYESKRFDTVPYLDASAAYDNGVLVINVVNRHKDQAIDTTFEAQDKSFAGPVEVSEVNGPDIKSENDFGSTKVKAESHSASAQGRSLRYSFPAHSYTMLKTKLV
jgi:alpha-L-arabinofuranosidase